MTKTQSRIYLKLAACSLLVAWVATAAINWQTVVVPPIVFLGHAAVALLHLAGM